MDSNVLILLPAFNEEAIIADVIHQIREAVAEADVLVVDDASEDNTREAGLSAGAHVVSLPVNLGIGGAEQTGFKFACEKAYQYVVRCDADGQHDVRFIANIINAMRDEQLDLCIGSRFIGPDQAFRSSWPRRLGILFFAQLISGLLRIPITDPTSGFRGYSAKALRLFSRHYPIDFPEPEAIVLAKQYGLRVKEIPARMKARETGKSSIRYMRTLYYMIKVTLAILLDMLHRRRRQL